MGGGPRYSPDFKWIDKVNKEYEDYIAWEKKETGKAKELLGTMESDDEELKKKKEAKFDPKKYFTDLEQVRDELMTSQLFNEKAYDELEGWKKKHEAAIKERVQADEIANRADTAADGAGTMLKDVEKFKSETDLEEDEKTRKAKLKDVEAKLKTVKKACAEADAKKIE